MNELLNNLFWSNFNMGVLRFSIIYMIFTIHVVYMDEGPSYAYQPTLVKCTEGKECLLVCSVRNLGSGTLNWQRNNIFIRDLNVRGKYEETISEKPYFQNSLIIKDIDRADAKYFYRCVANTGTKLLYSENGTVQVLEVPKDHYPLCSPKQSYSIGDIAKLTCTSEKTQNSKVSLHWYQNNVQKTAKQREENNKIISELSIQINADNKGSTFVCFQLVDVPDKTNKSCTVGPLDITFAPKISISGPPSIPLNSEELYVCSSTANPPTTENEWLEPKLPSNAYRLENNKQVLRILKATAAMNGTLLQCRAKNTIDTVQKTRILIIDSDKNQENPVGPITQPTQDTLHVTSDVSKILSVAGMCLLLTAVLIGLLLCYLQFCKFGLFSVPTNEERIAQPEVYFEPKDNIRCMMSPYDDNGMYFKRNVAIQVKPGVDTDSVYAEVEEGKKT